MKKIVSIFIILFIISVFITMFIKRYRMDVAQEFLDDRLHLKHGSKIEQSFKSRFNNLTIIKIMEATNPIIGSVAENQEKFNFSIIDKNTKAVIRTMDFMGANVGVMDKLQYKFDPIPDSKNKEYIFVIQSVSMPSATITELKFGFTRKEKLNDEFAMVSEKEPWIHGNLTIRTYYKDRIAVLISDSIYDCINRLRLDVNFAVVYLMIILSLGTTLMLLSIKNKSNE